MSIFTRSVGTFLFLTLCSQRYRKDERHDGTIVPESEDYELLASATQMARSPYPYAMMWGSSMKTKKGRWRRHEKKVSKVLEQVNFRKWIEEPFGRCGTALDIWERLDQVYGYHQQ